MREALRRFEERAPEIVFEWNDAPTGARGWVVINSLRGGAAGGGTRMRKGLDRREVESLAKTMEVKFTVSGPSIGGAKSGIDFDPSDPRRLEVLARWYRAVLPILKSYYGTGGDLNVDEIKDVVPITEALGLWHPQEGIVKGLVEKHLRYTGSTVALAIMDDWATHRKHFVKVFPHEYKRALTDMYAESIKSKSASRETVAK